MTALQAIGEEHQIDPGLLATRKIINQLVVGERDVNVLQAGAMILQARNY